MIRRRKYFAIRRIVKSAVVSFTVTLICKLVTSLSRDDDAQTTDEHFPPFLRQRKLFYVALISTESFLRTRVTSVLETWGHDVTNMDVFIGSRNNSAAPEILTSSTNNSSVIRLTGEKSERFFFLVLSF